MDFEIKYENTVFNRSGINGRGSLNEYERVRDTAALSQKWNSDDDAMKSAAPQPRENGRRLFRRGIPPEKLLRRIYPLFLRSDHFLYGLLPSV